MAESNTQSDQINQEQGHQSLKYLDFVHVAAIHVVVSFSRLYDYAKENSGPLKPSVQTVEGTVKTVVGPVYAKFHDVPLELLKFVDRKVGDSVQELDRHVPSRVKEVSTQAYTAAQKAPEVARSVAGEVQRAGVVATAAGFAKVAYTKAEPVAERCAVTTWRSLNRLPLFPQVAQMVLPTAAHWSEKYNQAVCYTAGKGYAVSAYLPLVPTERIAKVFGSEEGNATETVAAAAE